VAISSSLAVQRERMTDLIRGFPVVPGRDRLDEFRPGVVSDSDQSPDVIALLRETQAKVAPMEDLVNTPPVNGPARLDLERRVVPSTAP